MAVHRYTVMRPFPRYDIQSVGRGSGEKHFASAPSRVVEGVAMRLSCGQKPCLALTFDDGPNPIVTPQVLNILAKHQAHATFFVIGLHVPGNEGLLRRMHAEGHEIGNHSWGHLDMTTLSPAQIHLQVYDTQAVVMAAGVPAPRIFRPPYGAINQVVRSQVPLTIALWDIDPEDWRMKNAKQIIERVEATAKPGGMVDMHDIHQQTADALDPLLTNLQQHYQLVTVSELLQLAPGQPGVFYGR
jgi:peptidoglycan/xylan/chitin deacetylase (PgdA/CDA1 family)